MKDKNNTEPNLLNILPNKDILEAIGYAVSLQDKKFKIIYQNNMAKKIMGNHIGEFCYKAFERSDVVCNKCPLAMSYKDGRIHRVERRNPSRKNLVVEITASVIKDSEENIIAGMEVVKNITRRKKLEKEREKLVTELQDALKKVKTLKGLLPICACCHKVRDDKDQWTKVDVYIRDHSEADITHGYCPECLKKQIPAD